MNFMGEKLEAHFLAIIMYKTKKKYGSELKPEMKK